MDINDALVSITDYPQGGVSSTLGGSGIFVPPGAEAGLEIWIDPSIVGRSALLATVLAEGAIISPEHDSPTTALLVLAARSVYIFDSYCHPDWLLPAARKRYERRDPTDEPEPWTKVVMVKGLWLAKCKLAGRFLVGFDGKSWVELICNPRANQIVGLVVESEGDCKSLSKAEQAVTDDTRPPATHSFSAPSAFKSDPLAFLTAQQTLESLPEAELEEGLAGALDVDVKSIAEPEETSLPQTAMEFRSSPEGIRQLYELDEEETINGLPVDLSENAEHGVEEGHYVAVDTNPPNRMAETPVSTDAGLIFRNLSFWVDPLRPGRNDLIKRIKVAGGVICADYAEATHVLIHDYKPAKWEATVTSLSRQGVHCMRVSWAIRSLDEGVRLDETEYQTRGASTQAGMAGRNAPKAHQWSWTHDTRMSTQDLTVTFQEQKKRYDTGVISLIDIARELDRKNPNTYSVGSWNVLFADFRSKRGRFANLTAEDLAVMTENNTEHSKQHQSAEEPRPSASVDLSPPSLMAPPAAAGKSNNDLDFIFTENQPLADGMSSFDFFMTLLNKHQTYTFGVWRKYYHEWRSHTGRFANPSPSASAPSQTSKPMTRSDSSSSRASAAPNGMDARMSNEALIEIFMRYQIKVNADGLTVQELGTLLARKYGIYSAGTWRSLFSDWRRGLGRFQVKRDSCPDMSISARAESSSERQPAPSQARFATMSTQTPAGTGKIPTGQVADIFKQYLPRVEKGLLSRTALSELLVLEYGVYTAGTWRNYFHEWREQVGRFAKPNIIVTQTAMSSQSPPGHPARVGTKRTADSASSTSSLGRPSKKRLKRDASTMGEERNMGEYILEHQTSGTETEPGDWEEVQCHHPHRSVTGLTELDRDFKTGMDDMVKHVKAGSPVLSAEELGSSSFLQRDEAIEDESDSGSDESVMSRLAEGPDEDHHEVISISSG